MTKTNVSSSLRRVLAWTLSALLVFQLAGVRVSWAQAEAVDANATQEEASKSASNPAEKPADAQSSSEQVEGASNNADSGEAQQKTGADAASNARGTQGAPDQASSEKQPEKAEPTKAEAKDAPAKGTAKSEPATGESTKSEATSKETAAKQDDPVSPAMPAFDQSAQAGSTTVRVRADEDVFPAGARLQVAQAGYVQTALANMLVESVGGEVRNLASSVALDVKVLSQNGEELQPANGAAVDITFESDEATTPQTNGHVWHVHEGMAQELNVREDGNVLEAATTGFSLYVVKFSYGELSYSMPSTKTVDFVDINTALGSPIEMGRIDSIEYDSSVLEITAPYNALSKVHLLQPLEGQKTIKVNMDEGHGGPFEIAVACSEATSFKSLQQQVDAASSGDTIKLTSDVAFDSTASSTDEAQTITIPADKNLTIDLNGHRIDRFSSIKTGVVLTVLGTLTLADSAGGGQVAGGFNGAAEVGQGATLNMTGGTMAGNGGYSCSDCVLVNNGGTFAMSGSAAIENNSASRIVGVEGGDARFTMEGNAAIRNNKGDAVYVENGTFTMNGGTIDANSTGVTAAQGTLVMRGGAITNNAYSGTMTTHGGVFVNGTDASLELSGNTVISGNKDNKGRDCDVYFNFGGTIKVTGAMDNTEPIGVRIDATVVDGVFTKGYATHNTDGPWLHFKSQMDEEAYKDVLWSASDTEAKLGQGHGVSFVVNGGSVVEAEQVEHGKALTHVPTTTREGYVLEGWYTDEALSSPYDLSSPVTSDLTLYAKWRLCTYTLRYHKNAEDATGTMADQALAYNEEKTLATHAFARPGFVFDGWNTQADGQGTPYAEGAQVKNLSTTDGAVVVLYAQWKEIKTPVTDVVLGEGAPKVTASNLGEVARAAFTDDELTQDTRLWLEVAAVEEDAVAESERAALAQELAQLGATAKQWLGITLWKQVGESELVQVHEPTVAVALSLEVPEGLRAAGRTYWLLRGHEGTAATIAKGTSTTLAGTSDRFSPYVVAYKDADKDADKDAGSDTDNKPNKRTPTTTSGTAARAITSSSAVRTATTPKTADPTQAVGVVALCGIVALGIGACRRRRVFP